MAATTVSGIDPVKTEALLEEVVEYKENMRDILNDINGPIATDIRANYEGSAADALLEKIREQSNRVDQEMQNIVKNIHTNITQDLDDTRTTDQALSEL